MNVRRLEVLFALTLILMMYIYPLAIVGLWLLMGEMAEYRETIKRSLVVFIVSLPLYGAKIVLGISGWSKTLGITPVEASPAVVNTVHVVFLALQFLSLYFLYRALSRMSDDTGAEMLKTGGLMPLAAIPLHFVTITAYFVATWLGLVLIIYGFEQTVGPPNIGRA
ncbi:transposase [Thermococcus indicus]|uniref:Transposase n=1 Tax=Thermococcus indicus TaxID=2586643 RepID=A0A4Y5SLR2_9EURY|nr:transposase [Thermococcus indicus]QDA31828.1 transposase [Thermococcus indicus]